MASVCHWEFSAYLLRLRTFPMGEDYETALDSRITDMKLSMSTVREFFSELKPSCLGFTSKRRLNKLSLSISNNLATVDNGYVMNLIESEHYFSVRWPRKILYIWGAIKRDMKLKESSLAIPMATGEKCYS